MYIFHVYCNYILLYQSSPMTTALVVTIKRLIGLALIVGNGALIGISLHFVFCQVVTRRDFVKVLYVGEIRVCTGQKTVQHVIKVVITWLRIVIVSTMINMTGLGHFAQNGLKTHLRFVSYLESLWQNFAQMLLKYRRMYILQQITLHVRGVEITR